MLFKPIIQCVYHRIQSFLYLPLFGLIIGGVLTRFFTEGLHCNEISSLSTDGLPSETPPGENTSEASG